MKYRRAVLISCAVALAIYHLCASASMFPVPGGDAVVFMPPAINLKAGRGLTNSLWALNPDPTGQYRFLEHPSFFQMVVAACMWKAETRNAFLVLAIFNVVSLGLYTGVLCTAKFGRHLMTSVSGFGLLVASLFALAFLIFTNAIGRPEALSTLLLCLAIGVVTWLPQKFWPTCLGLAIGAAAAVHPTHGIFLASLAVLVFLATVSVREAAWKVLLTGAVSLPLFVLLLSLSPYSLEETFRAISVHAAFATSPDYRLSTLATYYVKLAPWSGLYLVALALASLWCGVQFWRSAEDRMTRFARVAALLATVAFFWYFSVRRPSASYYLMMLAPALAAGSLYLFSARREANGRRFGPLSFWIVGAFFGVFSLCLAREVALFINYRSDGTSFADAQKDFAELMGSSGEVISVSESLWVLADRFDRIRIVERGTALGDFMVLQQTQRQSLTPPSFPGYRLVSHNFIPAPPKWFGLPVARTMPGYSFAFLEAEASWRE